MKKYKDFDKFDTSTYNNESKSFNYEFSKDMFYIFYFSVVPMFDAFKFSMYNPHTKGKVDAFKFSMYNDKEGRENAELICSISGFRKDPTIFMEYLFNRFKDNSIFPKTELQNSLLEFIQYVEDKKIISD